MKTISIPQKDGEITLFIDIDYKLKIFIGDELVATEQI